MYDSFDMACHDEDTALRLNIKVNSENLLPNQQKYVGSLRLPADPSWPKIPQRRMADDVGNLVQRPCTGNLNGTPRRGRAIARIPQSQSCKLHYYPNAQESQNQQPRRKSGCTDPRFKKVTTVRSQTTSTDPGEQEINIASKDCRSVEDKNLPPWKSVTRPQVMQQAAEKPDETKEMESIGIQTVQNLSDMNELMIDGFKELDDSISETHKFRRQSCSPVKTTRKSPRNLEITETTNPKHEPSLPHNLQGKDVNNTVDENIVQTKPRVINNRCKEQSFDIQFPVISYQNVPVQISTAETDLSMADDIQKIESSTIFNNLENLKLGIPNDAVPRFCNIENVSGELFSDGQELKRLGNKNVELQKKCQAPEVCENNFVNPERETGCKCTEIKSKTQMNEDYRLRFESSPEKLMKNIHNEEKCRPQQNPNIFKDSLIPKHNFHIYCHEDEPFQSCCMNKKSLAQMSVNQIEKNWNQSSQKINMSFFNDRDNKNFEPLNCRGLNNCAGTEPTNLSPDPEVRAKCFRQKRKMKSEQHLMINKKRVQSSEPRLAPCGKRRMRALCLKKANSYFSKWTQELTPDSDSTLVYNPEDINFIGSKKTDVRLIPPTGLNDVNREHCTKPYERPAHTSAKISSALDTQKQNLSLKLPRRGDADTATEEPAAIPVKTQQLLNKSYWEYYNKLKLEKMENGESPQEQYFCQVAMGAPQSKKRRPPESIVEQSNGTSQVGDQVELSLPEIRTLEQCSVLSTMINKTLDTALQPSSETIKTKQIYLNANMLSSSDPTAGTQSAILKRLFPVDNEDSIVSSTIMYEQRHKRDKQFNKTSKLKSIGEHPVVFFGCMVYAMIVFLPMIYDYFSYEEHDEYEDLSYIEIAFNFIIASFKEAFDEFIDMMYKIFFRPDTRMQRLSSGKWRRRISKHHSI